MILLIDAKIGYELSITQVLVHAGLQFGKNTTLEKNRSTDDDNDFGQLVHADQKGSVSVKNTTKCCPYCPDHKKMKNEK